MAITITSSCNQRVHNGNFLLPVGHSLCMIKIGLKINKFRISDQSDIGTIFYKAGHSVPGQVIQASFVGE